jgi:hypothetical protein
MKKKIVFIFTGLMLVVPRLFSAGLDISGQVSPVGFMNFSVWTKYNKESFPGALKEAEEQLSKILGQGQLRQKDDFIRDSYNAYAIGADFRIRSMYITLNVGFPRQTITQSIDPLNSFLKNSGKSDVKLTGGSFIFSGQIGGGITLFRSSPFNLFLGAGVGFDFIKTTRKIENGLLPIGSGWTEERLMGLLGIGVNVGASYYFVPHIGLFAGITDNLSFVQMFNQRYYTSPDYSFYVNGDKNGKDGKKDVKKLISALVANNVAIRLGIALKL